MWLRFLLVTLQVFRLRLLLNRLVFICLETSLVRRLHMVKALPLFLRLSQPSFRRGAQNDARVKIMKASLNSSASTVSNSVAHMRTTTMVKEQIEVRKVLIEVLNAEKDNCDVTKLVKTQVIALRDDLENVRESVKKSVNDAVKLIVDCLAVYLSKLKL